MFFKDKAHTPNLDAGYSRYIGRCATSPKERIFSKGQYAKVVKDFCQMLSERLEREGMIDFPCGAGSVAAVQIKCKPIYDKKHKRWISTAPVDWKKTDEVGKIVRKSNPFVFGFTFLSRREKGLENFRCYGIRANRALYKKMKQQYDDGSLSFYLPNIDIYE